MTVESPITIRQKFHVARPSRGIVLREGEAPKPVRTDRVSPAAKVLALAHHIQELIDRGEVKSQGELAARSGLTRARLTQILNLLHLAPDIQDAILEGEGDPLSEHDLRNVVKQVEWPLQLVAWRSLLSGQG